MNYTEIVEKIISKRKEKGYSLKEMAEEVGMSRQGYTLLEKGRNVGSNKLLKALEVLGMEISIK